MAVTFVRKAWVYSIITRLSRTLTRIPVTKTTDNVNGAETLTEGASGSISGVFLRRNKKYGFMKEGLVETGDAYLMVKDTVTINKDDLIVVNSVEYRVDTVLTRYTDDSQSTAVYKYATLFVNE